jgi:hypothetical protein
MSKHLSSTAVFDSDLLIGPSTVSPDVKLHVIDSGTKVTPYADTVLAIQNSSVAGTNCVLNMISGNTGNCDLWFGDTDSPSVGYVSWGNSNDVLTVGRGGGVATFNSDGLTVTGTNASQVVQTTSGNRITSSNTLPFVKVTGGSGTATPRVGGMLHQNTTGVYNVTTGEDDLMTYTLPANTLSRNGDSLHVIAIGSFGAPSETKTLKLYLGGTSLKTLLSDNPISDYWYLDCWITRRGATFAGVSGIFHYMDAGGGAATSLICVLGTSSIGTLASDQTLKFTGEATSSNAISQLEMRVLYYPAHDA